MNILTIARTTSAEWLRRGMPIVGALLISGAVVLGLANHTASNVGPSAPVASRTAGQERFSAFKQAQAERVADAAMLLPRAQLSASDRYQALKDKQAESSGTSVVHASASGYASPAIEHYAAFKQQQAERVADLGMPLSPAPASWRARYVAFKDAQAEAGDVGIR